MEGALALVDPNTGGLRVLLKSIEDGSYQIGQAEES